MSSRTGPDPGRVDRDPNMPLDAVALAREPAFRLGRCVVRPSVSLLSAGEATQRLEPRVMQVLVVLARRPGGVVAREELLHACWGNVVVGDDALNRCIQRLRAALRELGADGVAIETVPRVGYSLRLAPGVTVEPEEPAAREPIAPESRAEAPAIVAPPSPAVGAPPGRAIRPALLAALAGLAGAAVTLGLFLALRGGDRGWEVGRIAPATASPGREVAPALSPDGGQLVFTARLAEGGNADLYLQSANGGQPIRLTTDGDMDVAADWSPDGSRVAFANVDPERPCRILVMAVPGGTPTEVARCRQSPWTQPRWTADGKGLVFSDRATAAAPLQLYSLALEDGTVAPLTRARARTWGHDRPAVSPDGRFVAFVDTPAWAVQDLHVLDTEDGTVRRVTFDSGSIGGVAWLRDGTLAFTSNRTGDTGLWALAPGSERPERLAPGLYQLGALSSARHADRLAVESWNLHTNLFELAVDGAGAEPARLTRTTAMDYDADVSPTDGALAFLSRRSGSLEVWVAEPGGEARRLTDLRGPYVNSVRWSPDGKRLTFGAARGGNFDIFVVDRDGSGLRRLTEEPEEDMSPAWGAGGEGIYFTSRRSGFWRIWRLDPDDPAGEAEPVTEDGPMSVRASPDGRWLYFVKEGEGGIFRRPTGGEGEEELVVPGFAFTDWPNWAVAADRLWYLLRKDGRPVLMRAGLDGQGVEVVAELPGLFSLSGLAVRPEGRSVIIARTVTDEVDVHLVDLHRRD